MAKRGLAGVTIRQLQSEIKRRQSRLKTLQRRRRNVQSQLDELDEEIATLGVARGPGRPAKKKVAKKRGRPAKKKKRGRPAKKKAKRKAGRKKAARKKTAKRGKKKVAKKKTAKKARGGRQKLTLPAALAKVMSKTKPMAIGDIVAAVKKAGYKSSSKGFRGIVSQTLAKEPKYRRRGRGQYVLK